MKCRLKDIADALNITVNTVSRALKNKSDISDATKKRVKAKAEELGYIPNISASSLRSGLTNTIGILYDNFMNPYYSIVTTMLENELSRYGYSIMIFTETNPESLMKRAMAEKIVSHSVDGVISFMQIDEGAKNILEFYGIPVIILGRDSSAEGVDSITSDDERGGYLATRHLVERGYRDVLILSSKLTISCGERRYAGYCRALEEAGIPVRKELLYILGEDGWNGAELVESAVNDGVKFNGIFCFNDQVAYEAIDYLEGKGLLVPEQFGVVGYDNIGSHLKIPCHLTTIDADKVQAAEVAVAVLMYKIENKDSRERLFNKLNPVRLIEGSTT